MVPTGSRSQSWHSLPSREREQVVLERWFCLAIEHHRGYDGCPRPKKVCRLCLVERYFNTKFVLW